MSNTQIAKDAYDIMENDKGEIMVMLYAGSTQPQKPTFTLKEVEKCLELSRNPQDTVKINGLVEESIEKLKNIKNLYICEMMYKDDSDTEGEIAYAYIATLKKKENAEPEQKKESRPFKQQLKDRLQKDKQKLLNKQ